MKPSVYKRPAKPLFTTVTRRRDFEALTKVEPVEILAVDRATECHVTPSEVAARMAGYLGEVGDYLTLEPSAGTGNLSRALLDSGYSPACLVQVERHNSLAARLDRFGPVINRCFLEYAEEVRGKIQFPRIIMNPPFSNVRKHIAAARSLLGGCPRAEPSRLVALVPVTFDATGAETLEILSEDTFATAKVRTKVIRYEVEA